MKNYKKINPMEMPDNVIKLIGRDWMLIGAGDETKSNAMTASWGALGYYSNKCMATVYVRPERYTNDFMESASHFTLTVLEEQKHDAHMIFGKMSGRDNDKAALAGLTPIFTEDGNPTFAEGRIVIECRKIFAQTMGEESFVDKDVYNKWYGGGHGGDHILYMGEIVNLWIRE
ncbi:MAG: flavin reductase family protein [Rikenellaceae bacterium]